MLQDSNLRTLSSLRFSKAPLSASQPSIRVGASRGNRTLPCTAWKAGARPTCWARIGGPRRYRADLGVLARDSCALARSPCWLRKKDLHLRRRGYESRALLPELFRIKFGGPVTSPKSNMLSAVANGMLALKWQPAKGSNLDGRFWRPACAQRASHGTKFIPLN